MAKKQEQKSEIQENPLLKAKKPRGFEYWLESNPKVLIGIGAALLLAVVGYFGFNYLKSSQNESAQKEMFQAVYYFESDSLNQALNGDANNLGFLDIIDEYGFSDAANLAKFYAGVCYLKKGEFETAIEYLEGFSSNDLLIQARAYSLTGDAYMELKKFDEAATYYNKAGNFKPNKYFSPAYLLKEALAYEKLNQNDKAKDVYQQIIDKYWDSEEYHAARKFKAKLEVNS